MKSKQKILFVGLALILLGAVYLVVFGINRPMARPITLKTPTQAAAAQELQPDSSQDTVPAVNAAPETEGVAASTQAAAPVKAAQTCGNSGTMRILVAGLTTPSNQEILGADAIRLVTIHFDEPSVTILAVPSLIWVDAHSVGDQRSEQMQLTTVYMKAFELAGSGSEQVRHQKATEVLAQTIVDNFGFVPDHYITVDEKIFATSIDKLGGIELNLPEAVDGTSEGYGNYLAGQQILDGARSLNFARLFHPGGMEEYDIWGNLDRQNMVVKGILRTSMESQNWQKIPGMVVDTRREVLTDLSLNQTLDLVCMVKEVGENAKMMKLGREMVTVGPEGRLILDQKAAKNLVAGLDSSE